MAAVLEYLSAEILELAGDVCEQHKKKTIAPKHINLGIRQDDELGKILAYTTIAQGGKIYHVEEKLQKAKKGKMDASQ